MHSALYVNFPMRVCFSSIWERHSFWSQPLASLNLKLGSSNQALTFFITHTACFTVGGGCVCNSGIE